MVSNTVTTHPSAFSPLYCISSTLATPGSQSPVSDFPSSLLVQSTSYCQLFCIIHCKLDSSSLSVKFIYLSLCFVPVQCCGVTYFISGKISSSCYIGPQWPSYHHTDQWTLPPHFLISPAVQCVNQSSRHSSLSPHLLTNDLLLVWLSLEQRIQRILLLLLLFLTQTCWQIRSKKARRPQSKLLN